MLLDADVKLGAAARDGRLQARGEPRAEVCLLAAGKARGYFRHIRRQGRRHVQRRLTGHGMGGGLATLAAYYIVGEMQAMSIPNRPVRVYTQGKPLIGNSDFAAAIEMLLQDPTSNLEVVKRHVLANELEAADRDR